MFKARIYHSAKREFILKRLDSGEFISALALGNLLKNEESLVVGDYVDVEVGPSGEKHIVAQYQRRNEIYRMIIREGKKKVIASNCDLIVILNSASRPEYKRGFVDRFVARAHQWGIPAVVVFNKMDEFDVELFSEGLKFEADRLSDLGVLSFEISAKNPEYEKKFLNLGLKDLRETLKNKTAIFVGQSGVGKSETIKTLCDRKVELKTSAISKVGKGSHTTTWAQIVDWGDFTLIDSPGVRSFALDDIPKDELLSFFPDLEILATKCQFRNCTHEETSKNCAFYQENFSPYKKALIHSRLESFKRIQSEVESLDEWKKK